MFTKQQHTNYSMFEWHTQYLLPVHNLVSAELTPSQGSNAVHHHQLDIVVNDAGLQSLHGSQRHCGQHHA